MYNSSAPGLPQREDSDDVETTLTEYEIVDVSNPILDALEEAKLCAEIDQIYFGMGVVTATELKALRMVTIKDGYLKQKSEG